MDEARDWYPYESGETMGKRGPAGGRILRDEEWGDVDELEDADARVTLETHPGGDFTVTANLYGGWVQETARFADEEAASMAYAEAAGELSRLADFIPDEEERDMAGAVETLNREVAAFALRFGGKPTT
ncbi:MAG: hypothetical protein H7145_13110 [Akkermansiaceae bacterium]|nr:hypothetical protein [Armatimonadota bacterium]